MTRRSHHAFFLAALLFIVLLLTSCIPEAKYSLESIPPTYSERQFVINNIIYSIAIHLTQGDESQQSVKSGEKPLCRTIELSVMLSSPKSKIAKGLNLKDFSVISGDTKWSGSFVEKQAIKTDHQISQTVKSCELLPKNASEAMVKIGIADPAGNIFYAQNKTNISATQLD